MLARMQVDLCYQTLGPATGVVEVLVSQHNLLQRTRVESDLRQLLGSSAAETASASRSLWLSPSSARTSGTRLCQFAQRRSAPVWRTAQGSGPAAAR